MKKKIKTKLPRLLWERKQQTQIVNNKKKYNRKDKQIQEE